MAVVVFTNGSVTLNSVDLSDHLKAATLDIHGAELDASSIADAWDVTVLGRKGFVLSLDFFDDFAASKVDATLQAAFFAAGSPAIPFTFKATASANSVTNPQYTGSVLPSALPVGGGAGALLLKSIKIKGTGAITRLTS